MNRLAAGERSHPGDSAYRFASLDAIVQDARSHGLKLFFTVLNAPDLAERRRREISRLADAACCEVAEELGLET